MIKKKYFYIQSSACKNSKIYVRQCLPTSKPKAIVLVLHGATMPSVIFDIKVTKHSMLECLAENGFAAYALDYRGYGRSCKPESMNNPNMEGAPLITHADAYLDVCDLLKYSKENNQENLPVALCGFSWGANIAGYTCQNQKIDSMVLIGPVYSFKHPNWGDLADISDPKKLNKSIKAYRIVPRYRWHKPWDLEIPFPDKSIIRDDDVLNAICNEIENSDLEWAKKTNNVGSVRIPSGVLQDAHRVYTKNPIYDAAKINCPTLIIRGKQDSASQSEDMDGLMLNLNCVKQRIDIDNATHYGILEKKADRFFDNIIDFFQKHLSPKIN